MRGWVMSDKVKGWFGAGGGGWIYISDAATSPETIPGNAQSEEGKKQGSKPPSDGGWHVAGRGEESAGVWSESPQVRHTRKSYVRE